MANHPIARLKKLSVRLYDDWLAASAAPAGPTAAAGLQAVTWRMHAEVGLSSFAAAETLRTAADLLDEHASGFPPDERFKPLIVFAIVGPPEDLGPGSLAFIVWHVQGRFADERGRLLASTNAVCLPTHGM